MKTKHAKLSSEEIKRLRDTDFSKKNGFIKASEVLKQEVGEIGSSEREEFNAKARAWYYGEVLRERRKELGMTQKELAELIGRERTYINRIEKGETDMQLSTFILIAEAVGLKFALTY